MGISGIMQSNENDAGFAGFRFFAIAPVPRAIKCASAFPRKIREKLPRFLRLLYLSALQAAKSPSFRAFLKNRASSSFYRNTSISLTLR
jgi:hypothetical protein